MKTSLFLALKKQTWSPYLSGIMIGFLQIPLFLFLEKSISGSGGYSVIADKLYSLIHSVVVRDFSVFMNWWAIIFMLGIILGAYLSVILSKKEKFSMDPFWKSKGLSFSFFQKASMSFAGGFFLLLGARIAGGCTSGHGLSGISKLQLHSFLFISVLFIVAIIFSHLLYKRSY